MLVNFLIFFGVLIAIFVLNRVYRSLKIKEDKIKEVERCRFRISNPSFKNGGLKKSAHFTVYVDNKHTFFVDFPVVITSSTITTFIIYLTFPSNLTFVPIFSSDLI